MRSTLTVAFVVMSSMAAACTETSRASRGADASPSRNDPSRTDDAAGSDGGVASDGGVHGWGPSEVVAQAFPFNLSVAQDGSALIVGSAAEGETRRIIATHFAPAEGWSAPETVLTPTAYGAAYFVTRTSANASGEAVTGWYAWDDVAERGTFWADRYTPGKGWAGAHAISDGGLRMYDGFRVAMTADGTALVGFSEPTALGRDYQIWISRMDRDSDWSAPAPIAFGANLDLVAGPTGTAMAVFSNELSGQLFPGDAGRAGFFSARFDTVRGWSAPEAVPHLTEAPALVAASGDDYLTLSLAWADVAVVNRFVDGSGWQEPRNLEKPGDYYYDLATSPGGMTAIVTSSHTWVSKQGSDWTDSGPLPVQLPKQSNRLPDQPGGARVGIDDAGNLIAVWQQNVGDRTIWTSRRDTGGAWSEPVLLGTGAVPNVAVDGAGNAITAWMGLSDGNDEEIRVARYLR